MSKSEMKTRPYSLLCGNIEAVTWSCA